MLKKSVALKTSITKEEVNAMPLLGFQGKIEVISSDADLKAAVTYLGQLQILGFDTESRPSFKKGQNFNISLLQLSSHEQVFLFRLNKIHFHPDLVSLLTAQNIKKVGVAIRDDIRGLQKLTQFIPAGFIEIADIAKSLNIQNLGLRNLTAICFSKRISKKAKLSNWENEELTLAQQEYAATDAWIGLKIYQCLESLSAGRI